MRSRGERDECDHHKASIKLYRLLSFLIIFVIGVIIGLTSSSHVDRYFNIIQADEFYGTQGFAMPPEGTADFECENEHDCMKVDCLSMANLISPKIVNHTMTDFEIFWRASMVPKKVEYPYDRVPKVAFMYLTRGPLPFLPLWERFFRGQDEKLFSIYVHTEPGYELNISTSSVFFRRQIPSQKVEWGSISLFDAERRLLANALLDFSNDRFILLSESCIPVYNFPTVYNYLTESLHSFVQSYDDPSRYGRGRYSRRMKPSVQLADWRKGSQWFELNRTLAIKVVADIKYYMLFKKYCKPACYPDEHYIPTLVHLFYGEMNSNRTVTYVDWSLGGPHPATFESVNVTEDFIESIRNNGTLCWYNFETTYICYLFARKFAPTALEPLLGLASRVMGF